MTYPSFLRHRHSIMLCVVLTTLVLTDKEIDWYPCVTSLEIATIESLTFHKPILSQSYFPKRTAANVKSEFSGVQLTQASPSLSGESISRALTESCANVCADTNSPECVECREAHKGPGDCPTGRDCTMRRNLPEERVR
jgi:hypothetical protein